MEEQAKWRKAEARPALDEALAPASAPRDEAGANTGAGDEEGAPPAKKVCARAPRALVSAPGARSRCAEGAQALAKAAG